MLLLLSSFACMNGNKFQSVWRWRLCAVASEKEVAQDGPPGKRDNARKVYGKGQKVILILIFIISDQVGHKLNLHTT